MDKKTIGIISTVGTALTCGCCGLFMCIFGAVTATGNMPYNTEVNGVQSSGMMPPAAGFAMLCLSVILIIIPIAVGFFTLRKKPEDSIGSIPPAS
jgi:hypothetical protein